MKRNSLYVFTLALITFCSFIKGKTLYEYPYKDPGLAVGKRVADLVSRMTLEEKIRQLDMYWGKEVANMKGHDASSYSEEKIKNTIGTTGIGSVHDFYPLNPEITNS